MTDLELAAYVRASGGYGLTAGESATVAARIEALVNDVRVLKADLDRSEDNVARLVAERDEARALLRGVRDWLVDDRLNTWRYMDEGGFYQDCDDFVARIDALLAGKIATDIETERRIAAGLDPDGGFDGRQEQADGRG